MKRIQFSSTTVLVAFSLARVAFGGQVLTMPYYDVDFDATSCSNTDWVSVRCATGDSLGPKSGIQSFTLTFTAHPGYVLTSLWAGAGTFQYAGSQGGWSSKVVFALDGTIFDSPFDQNVVYWQNASNSYETPLVPITPTIAASITYDYHLFTYGTGVAQAGGFYARVLAEEGQAAVPEPVPIYLTGLGLLLASSVTRRRQTFRK